MNSFTRSCVLFADDSEDDVFLMERLWGKSGSKVPLKIMRTGQQVIDYLARVTSQSAVDPFLYPRLILLDLRLPGADGFDVLRWLKDHPELKAIIVIVLTSAYENADIVQAYDLGANAVILKPDTLDGFVCMIRSLQEFWFVHARIPALSDR